MSTETRRRAVLLLLIVAGIVTSFASRMLLRMRRNMT